MASGFRVFGEPRVEDEVTSNGNNWGVKNQKFKEQSINWCDGTSVFWPICFLPSNSFWYLGLRGFFLVTKTLNGKNRGAKTKSLTTSRLTWHHVSFVAHFIFLPSTFLSAFGFRVFRALLRVPDGWRLCKLPWNLATPSPLQLRFSHKTCARISIASMLSWWWSWLICCGQKKDRFWVV